MAFTPKAKKMAAKPKPGPKATARKMPWDKWERTIPTRGAAPVKAKGASRGAGPARAKGPAPKVITKYVYVPAGQFTRQPWKPAGGAKFSKPVRGSAGKMLQTKTGKFGRAPGKMVQNKMGKFGKVGKFGKAVAKKVSNSIKKDFEIDKEARHSGTVVSYHKLKGCGFIKADDSDLVKENLFVYWKSIKSDDRFPSLNKDMQVEFGLAKKKNLNGKWSLCAKQVSLPGGDNIALQDERDSVKEFVGGKDARYKGKLKFFDPIPGFGYVKIAKGEVADDEVPQEIRVETAEVNAGGRQPKRMKDMNVEFGIWKTKKGQFKCYNMTAPGGEPLTAHLVEKRKVVESGMSGKIVIYNFRGRWGYIVPDGEIPQEARKKMAQQNKFTKDKGKEVKHKNGIYFRQNDCQKGFKPEKDMSVTFELYTDDKGVGACDISG